MLLIISYILQLESTNQTSRESTTDPPKSKKVSFTFDYTIIITQFCKIFAKFLQNIFAKTAVAKVELSSCYVSFVKVFGPT